MSVWHHYFKSTTKTRQTTTRTLIKNSSMCYSLCCKTSYFSPRSIHTFVILRKVSIQMYWWYFLLRLRNYHFHRKEHMFIKLLLKIYDLQIRRAVIYAWLFLTSRTTYGWFFLNTNVACNYTFLYHLIFRSLHQSFLLLAEWLQKWCSLWMDETEARYQRRAIHWRIVQ